MPRKSSDDERWQNRLVRPRHATVEEFLEIRAERRLVKVSRSLMKYPLR